jgi:cobalamin biosynthetic protein CobC
MITSMEKMVRIPQTLRNDSPPAPAPAALAHGGALAQARLLFPHAPEPFLDLSTGINPVPYPMPALDTAAFTRLPEPDDEIRLRHAAAEAYGVSHPDMVAAAPGTQMLISLLPSLLARPPGRVAIVSPTYSEHAVVWNRAGHTVQETKSPAALGNADIAVICNPNNPDGRRVPACELLAIADILAARAGILIVDESFADLEPDGISLAAFLPHPAVIILRSFGKSYGLAGLRLGFAVAAPEHAATLRQSFGPWAISGPALAIGIAALRDKKWREAAKLRLDADVARLDAEVMGQGASLIGGTRLFRLYEHPAATAIHDRLGAAGVLVRRFEAHPTRLRFGLPGSEACWMRLEAALAQVHTPPIS